MTISASLDKRLNRIVRKHERMKNNGVVHRIGRDGLIQAHPRLFRLRFPLRGLLIAVTLLIVFKALLFAQMGPDNYAAQVDVLRAGPALERGGAVVMQVDPVTVFVGELMSPIFFPG